MSTELGVVYESSLQFFGKMNASISHEINNVLAIINENAGLLEDFALMADKGTPISPARLKSMAVKILTQIKRADTIINNMNKLAHSVDERIKLINLNDLLELVVALSNRVASMRGVTLELNTPTNPLFITTNIFFLENLLWQCLDFSMDAADRDKTISLNAEITESHAVIRFSQLNGLKDAPGRVSPIIIESLLDALKGRLTTDIEAGVMALILPADINP
jgi:signal transduction histidine kinase